MSLSRSQTLYEKVAIIAKTVDLLLRALDLSEEGGIILQQLNTYLEISNRFSEVLLRYNRKTGCFYLFESEEHQVYDRQPTNSIWGIKFDPEEFAKGFVTFMIQRDYPGAKLEERFVYTRNAGDDEYRWRVGSLGMKPMWKLEEAIKKREFMDPLTIEFGHLRAEDEGDNHELMNHVREYAQRNFPREKEQS